MTSYIVARLYGIKTPCQLRGKIYEFHEKEMLKNQIFEIDKITLNFNCLSSTILFSLSWELKKGKKTNKINFNWINFMNRVWLYMQSFHHSPFHLTLIFSFFLVIDSIFLATLCQNLYLHRVLVKKILLWNFLHTNFPGRRYILANFVSCWRIFSHCRNYFTRVRLQLPSEFLIFFIPTCLIYPSTLNGILNGFTKMCIKDSRNVKGEHAFLVMLHILFCFFKLILLQMKCVSIQILFRHNVSNRFN